MHYQASINKLSKEVDVYCQWIDEAEERNRAGRVKAQGLGFEQINKPTRRRSNDEDESENSEEREAPTRPSLKAGGDISLKNHRLREEAKSEDEDDTPYTSKPSTKVPAQPVTTQGYDDSEDDLF